tara:strand:- start:3142 stop:4749 length:1608 start_codon:yes stop_codon:yes gene_type:complete
MPSIFAFESWTEDGQIGIRNSAGKLIVSDDIGKLLGFLRYSTSGLKVTFDLDEFIAPILRLLPRDVLERLSTFDDQLTYMGHELYYLSQRQFRCGKSRYYGIRDFFGQRTDEKPTLEEVQERAEELLATLYRVGLNRASQQPIRKVTSAIAIFEDSEWGEQVYRSLPIGADIGQDNFEMLEFASKADRREWVSNHQVGFFDEGYTFDYDRSSAYAYEATSLPDLRDLTYWKSTKFGPREQSALLGVVQGRFTLATDAEYAHTSPIMLAGEGNNLPCVPLGKLPTDFYTLDEVRHVQDNGLGTFRLKAGWFAEAKPGGAVRYPLHDIMTRLYEMRSISPLASNVCKAVANSLVGKMTETRATGELGQLRNDLWHCTVLARNRIAVSRFLIEHQVMSDQIVAIQTDGCKLTVDIPLPDKSMGDWVNKGSDAVIVVSPYKIYSLSSRPYQMNYADIIRLVNEHPLSQKYSKTNPHRITLIQAVRNYEDITRVGEVIDAPTSLDLLTLEIEQNREYDKLPITGRALMSGKYPSRPIILD